MSVLIEALKKLDPENNEHWTADGLPKVDTVKTLAGLFSVTREQITGIAPTFTRELWRNDAARIAAQQPAQAPVASAPAVQLAPAAVVAPAPTQPPAPLPLAVVVPEVKPPEQEDEEEPSEEAKLEVALAAAAKELEAANLVLRNAAEEQKAASDAVDQIVIRLDGLRAANPARPANEIQQYLASQNALRERRAAMAIHAKPDPRAPIDRAIGRK